MEQVKKYPCEDCPIRKRAEQKPDTLLARLWRWHTTWCPGWKAYQKSLAKKAS
jgi:hypothetical protein